MNFSDKAKEFMNVPETEDDLPIEEEVPTFGEVPSFMDIINPKEPTDEEIFKSTDRIVRHSVYHFMKLNDELINQGFNDKDERYRIIEIIL